MIHAFPWRQKEWIKSHLASVLKFSQKLSPDHLCEVEIVPELFVI